MDSDIVRKINACLNLHAVKETMNHDEINRFISLIEAGNLVFSGELTGFHIKSLPGTVIDCSDISTTLRPDYHLPRPSLTLGAIISTPGAPIEMVIEAGIQSMVMFMYTRDNPIHCHNLPMSQSEIARLKQFLSQKNMTVTIVDERNPNEIHP